MSEEEIEKLKSMYNAMKAAKEGYQAGKSDGRVDFRVEDAILMISQAVVYLLEKGE